MPQPNLTRRTFATAAVATLAAGFTIAPAAAQSGEPVTFDEALLLETGELEDMVLGESEAPVTIVEYASMTCPHCANFHKNVLPQLKEEYIDTGKARLIFREFPLDRLAAAASMLARCTGDTAFFPFVDVLFEEQRTWVKENPVEPLKKLAKQAGMTEESFDKCLANQELLDGIVWVQDRARNEFGVKSTPTFFVNGQLVSGAADFDVFKEIIEKHSG